MSRRLMVLALAVALAALALAGVVQAQTVEESQTVQETRTVEEPAIETQTPEESAVEDGQWFVDERTARELVRRCPGEYWHASESFGTKESRRSDDGS